MALTPAEKQKAYRERKRQQKREQVDAAHPVLKTPFSDWMRSDVCYSDFLTPFEIIGLKPPLFEDERGPEEFMILGAIEDENPFPGAEGAVGRAEVIVDYLLDAVWSLTDALNRYKILEIEARLRELESSKTAGRATAMKEAVRLNKMLDQLDKQVRRAFPQWKVTGV
ncbi:hypothetical protein KBY24_20080 [Ruegeria pomeroyi]|nr:hypothetical protein [Ruegeria pomeroyi]MCE8535687.1 hypothetical protein [Ruegeria pomeroyi]